LTAQYELLRSNVIGAAGKALQGHLGAPSRGAGLGLLLREGMPGRLNAIEAVVRASLTSRTSNAPLPAPPGRPAEGAFASPWLSGVQRQDITALLTNLVLSTRRVEHSCSPREG